MVWKVSWNCAAGWLGVKYGFLMLFAMSIWPLHAFAMIAIYVGSRYSCQVCSVQVLSSRVACGKVGALGWASKGKAERFASSSTAGGVVRVRHPKTIQYSQAFQVAQNAAHCNCFTAVLFGTLKLRLMMWANKIK